MSQGELSERLGYKSRSSINKIELDQRNLAQSKIKAIADALDTTPAYIMGWTDEPATETGDELDATTKELLNLAATLDPADVHMLLDMAKAIKARRKDDEK